MTGHAGSKAKGPRKTAVTIRDVALRAGVAVSTASRALGKGSASAKTREKVRKAAEELHFIPNVAARQLISGKSNIIAIVVPERSDFVFQDAFVSGVISQLANSFTKRGLIPFLVLNGPDDAQGCARLVEESNAAGIVVVSFHYIEGFAAFLRRTSKPVVFIGKPPRFTDFPYVDVDQFPSGYQAGLTLIERGCTRMAIIEGPTDMESPRARTEGFVAALSDHRMEPIVRIPGEYSLVHGEEAAIDICRNFEYVDGIFAHSDQIAAGAIRGLQSMGKKVPDDVAVVGFDDFDIAKVTIPQLTTFAQPLPAMADAATEMMVHRLESGQWEPRTVHLSAPMVRRESA